jgi:uncharacterized protein
MACTYCFYLEKEELFPQQKTHRMSLEVLEELVRQVMGDAGQQVSFGWQGGEPTLMGLQFFQKAVEFQKKYGKGQTVGNGLQTNGILIDEAWIKFLSEYKFLVGLSLDGPEDVHNKYRFKKNGKPSWAEVNKKAQQMLGGGVAVNALSVVNDYSVQFPEMTYSFFKQMGFEYMQFIPCVEPDPQNPEKAAPFSAPPEEYGKFLCTLFDLWKADFNKQGPTTSIRFFDSVFYEYVDMNPPECTLLKECGVYTVIEHNGDVFSCDFFVDPEWKLGNIMEGRIIDMLNSGKQRAFGRKKMELPDKCKKCRWLNFCLGGCTKDRNRIFSPSGVNYFCEAYRMFFEHADSFMRTLAEDWKKQRIAAEQQAYFNSGSAKKPGRNDPCPCGSGLKYKKCCAP